MQYLLELYEKDDNGIKEVLTKTHAQFKELPSLLHSYLAISDLPNLKLFCHKMANSALLVGARKMQSELFELEELINCPSFNQRDLEDRIRVIEKILPDELESIHIYLQFYL